MANKMTGADFYTAVQNLLGGFGMDSVLFYQLLNTARTNRELMRPWMRLRKYQYSQIVNAAQPVLAPFASQALVVPTDFHYLTEDGQTTLYDNNNLWQTYTEIPLQYIIPYLQINNTFVIDHANGIIYFNGVIDRQYYLFLVYQADLGDITVSSTWLNMPSRYDMMLAYDVAAMWRLGVDYDDINARNADENNRMAEMLFNSAAKWDDNLQRSATTRRDLPSLSDVGGNFNHKINVNG